MGDRCAMFEAIHGTAPRMIEEGLGDYANPESILRAAQMLLAHIGRAEAANRLARALEICCETERKLAVTGDASGATCESFGDYLMEVLAR